MPAASTLVTNAWPLANAGTQLVDPMALEAMTGISVLLRTSTVTKDETQPVDVCVALVV